MKCFLILLSVLFPFCTFGQNIKKLSVTKSDIQKGIKCRYEYNATGSFYNITLLLFKNGRYSYSLSSFDRDLLSEGKWEISGKALILNSDIKKTDVPVSLSLSNDTTGVVNGFKFGVVRNLKGDFLTDAFVNINNDSVKCLPMAAACIGAYKSIDSIRLLFENGFTSRWMKVSDHGNKHIIIRVNTDIKIASYVSFDNFKYLITDKEIQPIEGH